jgi:hypothetical protein
MLKTIPDSNRALQPPFSHDIPHRKRRVVHPHTVELRFVKGPLADRARPPPLQSLRNHVVGAIMDVKEGVVPDVLRLRGTKIQTHVVLKTIHIQVSAP